MKENQMRRKKKPNGYWKDFANVEKAILKFVRQHGVKGVMPTSYMLTKAGQSSLANAISTHGGVQKVGERIGMVNRKKPNGYWDDFATLRRELLMFVKEHGRHGAMPTTKELELARRSDLVNAIRKHGGAYVVAKKLGLIVDKYPRGYWGDFGNLEKELFQFVDKKGGSGTMPTFQELKDVGLGSLVSAIQKYGGSTSVAKRLGLSISRNFSGYWEDFENLRSELLNFIEETGSTGIMPTQAEILHTGRTNLSSAISKHGGSRKVAEKLGLKIKYQAKPIGFWNNPKNLEFELFAFIEEHKMSGIMPTNDVMRQLGRHDLVNAIQEHGGSRKVAMQLGLELTHNWKPRGYWEIWGNTEREFRTFIEEHGATGVMPTYNDLKNANRIDLIGVVQRWGGFSIIARRLGLRYIGNEIVTFIAASSVERSARAIQPLAESNLLSGAQVMVILRRAGLLDYRNQRIVRLNVGLSRGKHDEIESAIANLVRGGKEITVEPLAVAESGVLSAEEAEALASIGLDARETKGVQLSTSTVPDTQQEQAVIHGLSALGELRLPLDHVLQLLTSKILWQAFYKRLYSWYGSLDAAQTVTAEDVQAAILSAYPEHIGNEFVAEATALFTYEVEQAVNFAASLEDFGWRGPRLRLHQADAARRMAEVLTDLTPQPPFLKGKGEQDTPLHLGEGQGARFVLNADDPGMGKSASFLAAVCASGISSALLIAPKTVADDTWCASHGEIARCLPQARIVRGIADTLKSKPTNQLAFYVLHYEELLNEGAVAKLAERSFDCLCLDEIHFIKQRADQADPTNRRAAMEKLRAVARTAIGLTGTPLINELAEPMSLMQTLSQHAPQFDHARLSTRRMSDIADVFEAMLPHIIRRRKDETLLHLKGCDVRPVPIPLPPDIEDRVIEIYSWNRSRAGQALNALRRISIDAKLAYLHERAQSARKLLILTYQTDDISEKITAYLDEFFPKQVVHINGQTSQTDRATRINSFRDSNGARVLVGTIGTIGVGLTLFDPHGSDDTTNEIVFADLPYTYAEFDQGIARLYREGQTQRVRVDVLQTTTTQTLRDGSALSTLDERIWEFIEGKRELADIAIDGKYDTTDAASKVQKALRRWLKQAREIGVEPLAVERRRVEQTPAEHWRGEIGRLRGMSAAKADEAFADPNYTRDFLEHLKTSVTANLSHQWLRGKLGLLLRPDLEIVDMGCGLNPFADLPCHVTGLDRHDLPGQLRGKMENPSLPDKSADVLIYSLSLYGTASDLFAYFTQARRILRGGGHLFIVEPDSSFSTEGLIRFVGSLRQFGFELVGSVKDLRGEDGTLLKGMHLTLTGEMGKPEEALFERK